MKAPDWQAHWRDAWSGLGLGTPPLNRLEELLARYREPQRHYHTLQHLDECFAGYTQLREQMRRPAEVALALWYHDAVYEVRQHDNEARSAALAAEALKSQHAPPALASRIEALIMATRHHEAGPDHDATILLDIDLAILGAAPERFAEYEAQIRAEYAHVPAHVYRERRREVLDSFRRRALLFKTTAFQTMFERQARENLDAAIRGQAGF